LTIINDFWKTKQHGPSIAELKELCGLKSNSTMHARIKRLEKNFIWIDHHISAINDCKLYNNDEFGLRDTKFAACELTWQYFFPNEPMPEIVRLLGRYDCFGHKGTDEEQKVLEFQYGARSIISNYEEAYIWLTDAINKKTSTGIVFPIIPEDIILAMGKSIYQYLCTEAKQTYQNGFEIKFNQTHFHPHDGIKRFICINKERFNPINFGIDYNTDGYDGAACFHYDGVAKLWRFSLYNDNGNVDCSVIAKQFGGGGHKGAAGFVLNNKQFKSLING
jgi:oligoribonuclease NrnB/cAMP/cGMP phosphodiesterase (DHH superfamily)